MESLDEFCLAQVLIKTGRWRNPQPPRWRHLSCLGVCRRWRDIMLMSHEHLHALLLEAHGPEGALVQASRCTSQRVDKLALIRTALKNARADCRKGHALIVAAESGNEASV